MKKKKTNKLKVTYVLIALTCMNLLSAQEFEFGKVSKEEIQEKQHPTDVDADAAVLYREVETKFDYSQEEGFYITTDVFERIKIYNKDGFDWGTQEVAIYNGDGKSERLSGLKGYTYYLEGNKVKDEKLRNDGVFEVETNEFLDKTKFTLPNLQEGCVIEFKYSVKSPYLGNIDTYEIQEKIPVNRAYVKFSAPEYLSYKIHQKGWAPLSIKQSTKPRTLHLYYKTNRQDNRGVSGRSRTQLSTVDLKDNIYTIEGVDLPALKEEAFAGNIENYAAAVKFELEYTKFPNSSFESFASTWQDVSRTIYESNSFGKELEKSSYFDNDVDNLLQGISNPKDKMVKIFEFVKQRMSWNSFVGYSTQEGVKNAFKDQRGNIADINLMLVAMLRYAGLDSDPVLVSTKSNGVPLFPTRNGFNYVIASVKQAGETYLLDATNKENEINILEPEILNWQGRMLNKDGSSDWVSLRPKAPATESAMVTMTINDDLSVDGNIKCRYTGHYALSNRERYANMNETELRKKLEEDKADTELSNITFENLKTLYQPVNLIYDFKSFNGVEEVGNKIYLSPLLFLAQKENPFKLETRNYPIDFNYALKDRYLFTINVPEGYKVETLPEDTAFSLEQNIGHFRYAISNTGNKIKVSMELAINESLIPPDYYGSLKEFFELLIEKENEKVVLIKA